MYEVAFYYRNPTTRPGVYGGNIRDVNGVNMRRPGDDNPVGQTAWMLLHLLF